MGDKILKDYPFYYSKRIEKENPEVESELKSKSDECYFDPWMEAKWITCCTPIGSGDKNYNICKYRENDGTDTVTLFSKSDCDADNNSMWKNIAAAEFSLDKRINWDPPKSLGKIQKPICDTYKRFYKNGKKKTNGGGSIKKRKGRNRDF